MNVTVENLAPCKKLLRVECDAQAVDAAFDSVTLEVQRHAALPGFRAGKAPRHLIVKSFEKKIEQEVKQKLLNESYKKALEEQKLRPVTNPDIEEIQFGRGKPLQYAATVEVEPTFELPEYKGLAVKRESRVVTTEDVEKAIGMLREQRATYVDLAREVAANDFLVVNYTGSSEGKPITEIAPTAKGIGQQTSFWMQAKPEQFIPGFTDQLLGAKEGDKRTVNITFPTDFVVQELASKPGTFEVEIVKVKEKVFPDINDEFAKSFGAENLEKLREGVSRDLENELKFKLKRDSRDQLVNQLLAAVTCDLPEVMVKQETRSVVYDIVRANQERGVPKELIDEHKNEIYSAASKSALDRVKANLILARIAEKEKIQASREEMTNRILWLAQQNQIKPEKLVKQMQEQGGLGQLAEQIVHSKVLDLMELHAKVEEVAPAAS